MAVPQGMLEWVQRNYPRPRVDDQWLEECWGWIEGSLNLDPATQLDGIISEVERQLLQSNLSDSMVSGTGLPAIDATEKATVLGGQPILVEIIKMTEVGHSAFSLQNVRQARLDHEDLAGLATNDDEDEGPVPKYPRSMLKIELSDGDRVLEAFEYRRLPQLQLGETKLGYKMLLKNVRVRRGFAYLEPKCVVMKGGESEERSAMQDHDFAQSLRRRLGQPDLDADDPPEAPPQASARHPSPTLVSAPAPAPVPARDRNSLESRSPLRDISEPPESPAGGPSRQLHDDDEGQPRRRKVPDRTNRSPSPMPPPRNRKEKETQSRYFGKTSAPNSTAEQHANTLWRERLLSPHRQPPIPVPDSDDDDLVASARAVAPALRDDSSEYDFDLDIGEAMREVDRVEQAFATQGSATTTLVGTVRATPAGQITSSAPSASASAGPSVNPRYGRIVGARPVGGDDLDADVINIDSDEDDKENVPAPTRHQRRRINFDEADAIEISD